MNYLVTAAGGMAGVGALRLLSRYCVNCYATDIDPYASGRLFAKDFRVMSRVSDLENYTKDLKQMIQDWNIDWVIPILPEELEIIEDIVKQTKAKILISPKDTITTCCNKAKFYEWAEKNVPECCAPWRRYCYVQNARELVKDNKVFVKPVIGRGSRDCYVFTLDQFSYFIHENKIDCLIMEYLPGSEWTVDCYVTMEGNISFIVPRQRLQTLGGVCIKGKTVKNQTLIQKTQLVLEKMKFFGPICVQWKEDRNGDYKLLEINPRLSGGCLITAASGADAMHCFLDDDCGSYDDVIWNEVTVLGYNDYKILEK